MYAFTSTRRNFFHDDARDSTSTTSRRFFPRRRTLGLRLGLWFRIRISVCVVRGYEHVLMLLSVVIVTPPITWACTVRLIATGSYATCAFPVSVGVVQCPLRFQTPWPPALPVRRVPGEISTSPPRLWRLNKKWTTRASTYHDVFTPFDGRLVTLCSAVNFGAGDGTNLVTNKTARCP